MGRGARRRWLAMVVAVAALSGCGGGHAVVRSWTSPNGDPANTRHVPGPIDAGSVARLRVAWTLPIGLYATTPIVRDGVLYTQDLLSNVYAIDVASGKLRWRHRYDVAVIGPNGVNLGGGRVYGATLTEAFALDARSGRELWRRSIVRNLHEGIDMAPGYDDGTVYVSTVPARPDVQYGGNGRATLWALDARTGAKRWTWAQVPPALWGDRHVNSGGGLWYPPAFDGHGHLYASTANPGPFPGTLRRPWGGSRPGPNRWTNSIVKLDARTGKLLWGRQVLPHDIFDWDLQGPVVLQRAGGRELALVTGKLGWVYAFDAVTGALRWKRSVGRHDGHDHDNLKAMRGEPLPARMRLLPGISGGVITPMAVAGGTAYVPVTNQAAVVRDQLVIPTSEQASGEMVALDVASGRVKWDRALPDAVYGGATVTNDLVFTTTFDGTLWALDAASGRTRWKARLPAGSNAPVAVAGDTVLAAGSVALKRSQKTKIVAYRLG